MNIFEARRIGEELTVRAKDLLEIPEHVHPRIMHSLDGLPWVPDGAPPIIIEVEQRTFGGVEHINVLATDECMRRFSPEDEVTVVYGRTNPAQDAKLRDLCERNHVEYDPYQYSHPFGLPDGYVGGLVGGVYYGVDTDGRASS